MEADTSRVLMSDSLKGQIPDIEEQTQALIDRLISVTAKWHSNTDDKGANVLVGSLRTFLMAKGGDLRELEFRVLLEDALDIASASAAGVSFASIELKHGERTLRSEGLTLVELRIIDTDLGTEPQMCTLALGLMR